MADWPCAWPGDVTPWQAVTVLQRGRARRGRTRRGLLLFVQEPLTTRAGGRGFCARLERSAFHPLASALVRVERPSTRPGGAEPSADAEQIRRIRPIRADPCSNVVEPCGNGVELRYRDPSARAKPTTCSPMRWPWFFVVNGALTAAIALFIVVRRRVDTYVV